MPLYEYQCRECGSRVEAMRRMSERSEGPPCPACGAERTELGMSAPAAFGGGSGGGSCSPNAWTGGG